MSYSEAAYFDHNHCQHCADREEWLRLQRRVRDCFEAMQRRQK